MNITTHFTNAIDIALVGSGNFHTEGKTIKSGCSKLENGELLRRAKKLDECSLGVAQKVKRLIVN